MTSEAVRRVRGDSPWDEAFGSARAVAAGDRVLVAAATAFNGDVLYGEGDPYEQAKAAFGSALEAIAEFGLGADSVIRTRVYLAHSRDIDAAGRAHKELFDTVRPVTTLLVVGGFMDSRVLVSVEVEAFRGAVIS
ncbi:Rid family hydrolase [Streptomyces sp. KMM 9044]|uniref:Rid family hydrolase n=1 Tax=Streptomyces sp. KMM 9044 TaxID=2744474 RepID=UPI002151799B|nr:Rid family hydrolase [Streptomyces sp. KMM 9044]WAX80547.1 Rid family hydrolase [Streptomyces sp. KMM 9044]